MCQPGNSGADCNAISTQNQSCFVNITNPPLYKGCNGTDSDYYMYSLGGYAPCYFYDFTATYRFKLLIQCMAKTYNPTDITNPRVQQVGYAYRDVVE